MRTTRLRSLIATLLALLLVLAACSNGDDAAPEPEAEDDAPLALDLDDADDADEADEEPVEEEPVEEFDLVDAVDFVASTLPDGWMLVREVDDLKDALEVDNTVLIDVREPGEFAEGHIPGAIHIPVRELASSTELIPRDRPVIIYCLSGWRAGLAISSLRLMGYDNISAYAPGINGWTAAGEELVNEDNVAEDFGTPELQPEMVAAVDGFLATIPEGFYTNPIDTIIEAVEDGATLVDMREPGEFEEGFIPGALSVPLRTLVSTDVEVPADGTVYVYCQSGYRAALALPMYHVLGWTNTQGFPGSFAAWVEAGEVIDS